MCGILKVLTQFCLLFRIPRNIRDFLYHLECCLYVIQKHSSFSTGATVMFYSGFPYLTSFIPKCQIFFMFSYLRIEMWNFPWILFLSYLSIIFKIIIYLNKINFWQLQSFHVFYASLNEFFVSFWKISQTS
jgi:hypothetical protein